MRAYPLTEVTGVARRRINVILGQKSGKGSESRQYAEIFCGQAGMTDTCLSFFMTRPAECIFRPAEDAGRSGGSRGQLLPLPCFQNALPVYPGRFFRYRRTAHPVYPGVSSDTDERRNRCTPGVSSDTDERRIRCTRAVIQSTRTAFPVYSNGTKTTRTEHILESGQVIILLNSSAYNFSYLNSKS